MNWWVVSLGLILLLGCSRSQGHATPPPRDLATVTVPLLPAQLDDQRGFNVLIKPSDRTAALVMVGDGIRAQRGTPLTLTVLVCNGLDEECFVSVDDPHFARQGTHRHFAADGGGSVSSGPSSGQGNLGPRLHALLHKRRRPRHGWWDDATLSQRLTLPPPSHAAQRSEYELTCHLHGYLRSGAPFVARDERTITVEWTDTDPRTGDAP